MQLFHLYIFKALLLVQKLKKALPFFSHLVMSVTGHEQALARVITSTNRLNEVSRMCYASGVGRNQSCHSSDVHSGEAVVRRGGGINSIHSVSVLVSFAHIDSMLGADVSLDAGTSSHVSPV